MKIKAIVFPLAVLFISLLACSVCASAAEVPTAPDVPAEAAYDDFCPVRGDTDFDGHVTASDARNILRISVGLENADRATLLACIVDDREDVTAADARLALRISVGVDPAPGHFKEKTYALQEPTCAVAGVGYNICLCCGESYGRGVIPKTGHVAEGMTVVTPATCSAAGVAEKRCMYCNTLIETIPLAKTAHDYGPMQCDQPLDCTRAQNIYYVCAVCGDRKEDIKLAGSHNFAWIVTVEPTCMEMGSAKKVCSVCGMETGEEKPLNSLGGHIRSPWQTVTYATAEHEGLRVRVCTRCGETLFSEVIPKRTVV